VGAAGAGLGQEAAAVTNERLPTHYPRHRGYPERPLWWNGCRCAECVTWYAETYLLDDGGDSPGAESVV